MSSRKNRKEEKKTTGQDVLKFVAGTSLCAGTGALIGIANYFYNVSMKPIKRDTSHDEEPSELPYMAGRKWMNEHPDRMDLWEKAEDGLRIHANFIPSGRESEHRFALCVHGYSDSAESMGLYARVYHDKYGMNVLMPDLRGHGLTDGDYVGYGYDDRLDILLWIDWILRLDPDALIILHGISMGAATVLMVTGELLPKNVKACVEDASYTSALDEFLHIYQSRDDKVPIPGEILMQAVRGVALVRAGYDLDKAAPVKAVKKSVTPTLFIHGDADSFIPCRMMDKLFEAAACRKERLLVHGAEHVQSANKDPEGYWNKVHSFLESVDKTLVEIPEA